MAAGHTTIRHALSIDVEDWYHDAASSVSGPREQRVETNTLRLLDLLAEQDARATFFFLGEVAERFPALVRRAAADGHEIASHGYQHRPVHQLLRREFLSDVQRSVELLQDVCGRRVTGYRAPYFSIKADVRWPIEVLAGIGLGYDSSILAIDRPPGLELVCPRQPFRHAAGLWEVPVGMLRLLFFWHLPLASGAGLRMLPRKLFWRSLERFERDVGPAVFYLHPWELDAESPVGPGPGRWLLRYGRRSLPDRLRDTLRRRSFAPIGEVFAEALAERG